MVGALARIFCEFGRPCYYITARVFGARTRDERREPRERRGGKAICLEPAGGALAVVARLKGDYASLPSIRYLLCVRLLARLAAPRSNFALSRNSPRLPPLHNAFGRSSIFRSGSIDRPFRFGQFAIICSEVPESAIKDNI